MNARLMNYKNIRGGIIYFPRKYKLQLVFLGYLHLQQRMFHASFNKVRYRAFCENYKPNQEKSKKLSNTVSYM